jgi:O-antigen/teichoic acid export membrane protein
MDFTQSIKKLKILLEDIGKKGFFHLLSSNILLKIVGSVSTLLVVKWLTPEELGQIATMRAITQIAFIVATFGFNTSILKLCSELRPVEEKAYIFRKNLLYTASSIFIVLIILYLLAKFSVLSPDEKINDLLPYFMLSIPAGVILNLFVSYLQAMKQIKEIATVNIYARFINLTAIILLTYFWGLNGYIFALVVLGYFILPLIYRYLKDLIKNPIVVENTFSSSFFLAKWSVAANSITTVGNFMDVLMLNFLTLDRDEFGYYSAAALFMVPVREITKTVRDIALPYFSEKQNNREEFFRVLKKYKRLMFLLAIGVAVAGSIAIPIFVKLFYGEEYANTSIYFMILAVGFIFHSNAALIATSVIAVGKMRYNFFSSSIYVPLSLGLNYFFISYIGVIGAAIAQTTASLISMIVIILLSSRGLTEHFNELENTTINQ